MTELLNMFDVPFDVQGIAIYLKERIVIPTANGKYTDVEFRQPIVCYLRRELKDSLKDEGFLECGVRDYKCEVKMHLVVIDNGFKYTLDSIMDTMSKQLNTNKDITITQRSMVFDDIKADEKLTEIKDGQMVRISFDYLYELTDNCNGLICQC